MIFPGVLPVGSSQAAGSFRTWGTGHPQLVLPKRTTWLRELPEPGTVAVRPGQQVQSDTIVAEGARAASPVLIDLRGAEPLVRVGETVAAGQVVARRQRLLRPPIEVRTGVPGEVRDFLDDHLVLGPLPAPVRLPAQLPGTVTAVHDRIGVEIEACLGVVHGVGALGWEVYGRLGEEIAVLSEPATRESLRAAKAQGARGVVAPSLTSAPDEPFPCLLLDVPAASALAPPIAAILLRNLGAPAALQLGTNPRLAFLAPESDVTQPAAMSLGCWVRAPFGLVGRLAVLPERPRYFASGIRASAAEVDFGDRTASLPLDDLFWVA